MVSAGDRNRSCRTP